LAANAFIKNVTYGPKNRTGTQYIDLTIINRAGMFVR
jgi:hypothetical protein